MNQELIIPISTGFALGSVSKDVLSKFMYVGQQGVSYYGEAHLSPWNAWIHTMMMPFSIYGILLWIPALLRLEPKNARKLIWFLYYLWGGHYYDMNKLGALMYFCMYWYTVNKVVVNYRLDYEKIADGDKKKNDCDNETVLVNTKATWYLFKKGILYSSAGLLFQEGFGHWIGGDIPSRPEAVLNAIIYAMYFSAAHILGY
tara:strand:+ start:201 stop:803 length:603 start_codon:yes stop_codon:yes gene_type:complete